MSLVGRFLIGPQCSGLEFVPASTSAKYKCEIVGRLSSLDLVAAVTDSAYVSIGSWKWLANAGGSILVVDGDTFTCKTENDKTPNPLAFTAEVSAKKHSGQIKSISTFLRIKEADDPFNDSFCIHLEDGNIFVFRGQRFFPMRYLLEPRACIELCNFRKIKLKSFSDRIVYLSVEDSRVSKYEALNPETFRPLQISNSLTSGAEVRGRVIAIDAPNIWITILGRTNAKIVPIVVNKWGLCDKRRIGVGAILEITNFHYQHDVIGLCPAMTSLVVENIPPLATGVIGFHQLSAEAKFNRCFAHNVDICSVCQIESKPVHRLGINSLCACDCLIECGAVGDSFVKELSQLSQVKLENEEPSQDVSQSKYLRRLKELMKTAIREAEVCLSLLKLKCVWQLESPPYFNIRISEPLSIKLLGAPTAEVTAELRELPNPLFLSLFPPYRPLNSFCLCVAQGHDARKLFVLFPRTVSISETRTYSVTRLLVINTAAVHLHGIVISPDGISVCKSGGYTSSPSVHVTSPSKSKLGRRRLLEKRLLSE